MVMYGDPMYDSGPCLKTCKEKINLGSNYFMFFFGEDFTGTSSMSD